MSIEQVELDEKSDQAIITFIGTAREANRLRRIFLEDIPTLAVDTVNFFRNTSVREDEFLENRLQMIPVMKDAKKHGNNPIKMRLQKKGCIVRSQDLTTDDGDSIMMHDHIIVEMKEKQVLELELLIRIGTAKEHARWSAVGPIGFEEIGTDCFKLTVNSIGVYKLKKLVKIAAEKYGAEIESWK